jgi:hypothetical protein
MLDSKTKHGRYKHSSLFVYNEAESFIGLKRAFLVELEEGICKLQQKK